jgi:hypothetical protein
VHVLKITLFIAAAYSVVPAMAQQSSSPVGRDRRTPIPPTENLCIIDVGSTLVIRDPFTIPAGERCISRMAPHQIDSGETLCHFCLGSDPRAGTPATRVSPGDYRVTAAGCGMTATLKLSAADGASYELDCGNDYRDPRSIQNFINAWSRPGRPGPFFRGTVTHRAVAAPGAAKDAPGADAAE